MSHSSVIVFNNNLELLLNNIQSIFSELSPDISNNYTFPLTGTSYIDTFVSNNTKKYNDISNKNDIIFSKGLILLEHINFNYIWNNSNLSQVNKETIWKYLQTMVLYSIEYKENVNIKNILSQYKINNTIDNDHTRLIVNILHNLSNEIIIPDTNDEITPTDTSLQNSLQNFKLPDLSNILGKHLMELIQKIMDDIDIGGFEINNPLELIQTLLDKEFSIENDTTGISSLVKNIIDNLKKHLSSEDLNRPELFKEIQNVLQLFNNITNNKYDLDKVCSNLNSGEFQSKFDDIINSLDFDILMGHFVEIVSALRSNSSINIPEILEKMSTVFSEGGLENLSSLGGLAGLGGLGGLGGLMNLFNSVTGQSPDNTTDNDDNDGNDNGDNLSNIMSSLNIESIVGNVMKDMNIGSTSSSDGAESLDMNDIDISKIFKSVSKNLPQELTKNLTPNMSQDFLNQLPENIDMEQIKKMVGGKKSKINNSKLNQLSRLEKRRERLRRKLKERKQQMHQMQRT